MGTIIFWIVFWGILGVTGTALFYFAGLLFTAALEHIWPFIVGWLLGVAWGLFAAIQFFLKVIELVNLVI